VLGTEEGLVDDITTPGGLRPLPDPADLRRFVDNASSMDGLKIAELLRGKMVRGTMGLVHRNSSSGVISWLLVVCWQ